MTFKVFLTEERERIKWLHDYYVKLWAKSYYKSEDEMRKYMKDLPVKPADGEGWMVRFNEILAADPTPSKAYSKWLLDIAFSRINPNFTEDRGTIRAALEVFDRVKRNMPVEKRDIAGYKKYHDLFAAIEPFVKSNREVKREEVDRLKSHVITVYSDSSGTLYIPTTEDAAKYLGRGTQWCTAADNNNMFDDYNDMGPLFVYVESSGRKVQYHCPDFLDTVDSFSTYNSGPVIDHLIYKGPDASAIGSLNGKYKTELLESVKYWAHEVQLADENDKNYIAMWAGMYINKFSHLFSSSKYCMYGLGIAVWARSSIAVHEIVTKYVSVHPKFNKEGILALLRFAYPWLK